MFKDDRLTVKREHYELIEGEAIYSNPVVVFEDIPCHLSVSLNNTTKINSAPFLESEYTLFLDYDPNININKNDILLVKTSKNEHYKLFAGDIKAYNHSIQIKCKQQKIIES